MTPTPRQLDVLRFVRDFTAREGFAPTYDEIGIALRLHKVTVFEHVGNLIEGGYATRDKHKARAINITDKGHAALTPMECPHCGKCLTEQSPRFTEDRHGIDTQQAT